MDQILKDRIKSLNWRLFEDDVLYKNHAMVPNFVFPYTPKDEFWIDQEVKKIIKITSNTSNKIIEINLLELFVMVYDKKIERVKKIARDGGVDKLIKLTSPQLKDSDTIVSKIAELSEGYASIIITGVGAAYPMIHVTNLLKRFPAIGFNKPILVFYPGSFNGLQLKLFDRFEAVENEYQINKIA